MDNELKTYLSSLLCCFGSLFGVLMEFSGDSDSRQKSLSVVFVGDLKFKMSMFIVSTRGIPLYIGGLLLMSLVNALLKTMIKLNN